MASIRGDLAAARVAAAAQRGEQLRERIARLRAGEASTPHDVVMAEMSAANQRDEALRAHERLLRAYASAAELRDGTARGRRPRRSVRTSGEPTGANAAIDENRVLRHALVSIATSGVDKGGWSKEQRRELWQLLIEQCGQSSWQGWSRALCHTAVTLLPGLHGVALSGFDEQGSPHLLAVSDDWTRRAEEVGQLVGEGPAVEAHRTQMPVAVGDLADEQARWPLYVATAAGVGLSSVYSLPVQLDGIGLGALTLYPHDQGGTGWRGWPDGIFLAGVAAKALLADLDAVEDGWPLGDFSDDRISIATGMLAVRMDVSVDEASARLRAFAFSNARGLGEVAESVLDGSLRLA